MEPENRYRENGYMTLYERTGVPAAYIDRDGEHIYLFDGSPAAYIHGDAVYGFDAASYTHLDVYKRQPLWCQSRKTPRTGRNEVSIYGQAHRLLPGRRPM